MRAPSGNVQGKRRQTGSRDAVTTVWLSTLWSIITLVFGLLCAPLTAVEAQQAKQIPRIGFLGGLSPSALSARIEAFRQGLREVGYLEGKSLVIEYRWAEGKLDRLPDLAVELVRLKVDVIVTAGGASTRAASYCDGARYRPGWEWVRGQPGATGRKHYWAVDPRPRDKRKTTRASQGDSSQALARCCPGYFDHALREAELAAGVFGVKLQYLDIRGPRDIETALWTASQGRAHAVLVLPSPVATSQRTQITDLAVKSRLPAIYARPEFVEGGGLMSYSVSSTDLFRRAAYYVDRILKGTKPADLPVEQPMKFEFVINLKTAKQIGLTIPPTLLFQADKVIK